MPSIRFSNVSKLFGSEKMALEAVTFQIQAGERLGIIGSNGAGKSTLLSIMSGITEASTGSVSVEGNVASVLSLGSTYRDELTGRELILQEYKLRGASDREAREALNEAVAFADVGQFIDLPLRTYSSGMKARVLFAASVFASPDILILDETLSVGDYSFNAKAESRMLQMVKQGSILVFTSHSMNAVLSLCTRCIWLDHGRVIQDGAPNEVTSAYLENSRGRLEKLSTASWIQKRDFSTGHGPWTIHGIASDASTEDRVEHEVMTGESLALLLTFTSPSDAFAEVVLTFENFDGTKLLEFRTALNGDIAHAPGLKRLQLFTPPFPLNTTHCIMRTSIVSAGELKALKSSTLRVVNRAPISGGQPTYIRPVTLQVRQDGAARA